MKTLLARLFLSTMLILLSPQARCLDSGYTGAWYNPAQSGHGIFLEILSPTSALFSWYVYDNLGNQAWVYAEGTISGSHVAAQGYITKGMRFGSFNPSENSVQAWGNISLDFTSCTAGTMSWQSTYNLNGFVFGNGSVPIQRLSAIDGLKCGKRLGSGAYAGFIATPTSPDAVGVIGLLDERGQLTFVQNDGRAIYFGSYAANGSSLAISAAGYAAPGFTFSSGNTTATFGVAAQFSERDYVTGIGAGGGSFSVVSLAYDPVYDRGAAISRVAGNYSAVANGITASITISSVGSLSGSDTAGCLYQGTVGLINSQFNTYTFTVAFGNCGSFNGTYTGVGVLTDYSLYGDNRRLIVGGRGPVYALVRTLVRQ